jgi:phospholipase/carboxylesterase
MSTLVYAERPAAGEPDGLLFLQHGRGADEHDLLGLADALDPQRRLHVVCPRAPFVLEGAPGYHWYVVRQVGKPDAETAREGRRRLETFHDETWARLGIPAERSVIGGFSQGCVMSYVTALDHDRPRPAGILALSGFLPEVDDWRPDLTDRTGLPVLVAHGTADPVIDVAFAHAATDWLRAAGLAVDAFETGVGHTIDPATIPAIATWLRRVLPA